MPGVPNQSSRPPTARNVLEIPELVAAVGGRLLLSLGDNVSLDSA